MYKEHPVFTPPPDDAILWRYMDFPKFVSLVDSSSLFFPRADQLGDPFEGSFSPLNFSTLAERYTPDVAEGIRKAMPGFARLRASHFINCWHWNDYESDAMWKIYSEKNAGIAVKTDFASLAQSFIGDTNVFVGQVRYVDYNHDMIPESNVFYAYLHKRNHFAHEREVRAIATNSPGSDDPHPGLYCEVDLSVLIHAVVLSPLAPAWIAQLVRSVADKYGLQAPITASILAERPTWE